MGCKGSKFKSPARGPTGYPSALTQKEILDRLDCPKAVRHTTISGLDFSYAYVSQRGFYPDSLDKPNQDSFSVLPKLERINNTAFFAVYDGHGSTGHLCAQFAREKVLNLFHHPKTFSPNNLLFFCLVTRRHK